MNARLSLFSFAVFLMTSVIGLAQSSIDKMIPKPVPKSPNAAGIDKFGDYEVSHFTGLPSISIPIFEARSGELSVPITLNYHASGNRPTDVASWVGLGWSLSAGGQITRRVNGKKDEDYYFSHPLHPSPSSCTSYYYLQYAQSQSGWLDTEPDIFSYSYPGGGAGKFLFVTQGTYVNENSMGTIGPAYLFPYAPIVVNRVNDQKFQITNERGILYRFGTNAGGTVSTEQTNAYNGGNPTVQATTAWNLMDIVAPNSNDAINFSYQSLGTASRHDVTHTWMVSDQCNAGSFSCPTPTHGAAYSASNNDSNVNQQGVFEIFFATGKVKFIPSLSNRADQPMKYLDKIEIYELFNSVYTIKKVVDFSYSYFTDAGGANAALKLDGIQFQDAALLTVQSYTFEYHTNTFSWNGVTGSYLAARDYWGFYNGATGNTDLVPRQSVSYQATGTSTPTNIFIGGGFNRDVNATHSKEGVLKKINFPTGGYTEFDYENHKYLNDLSVVTNSGGLRVTKITSREGATATPIVKTYKYGLSESGVGRALFSSNQLNYRGEQLYAGPVCDGVSDPLIYRIRTYPSSSFDVEESSPVVYGYVTEYLGDPAGTTNGKIIYEYDANLIWADMDQTVPPSTKVFRNSYAWNRGKLTMKTVFDRFNNKLTETATVYSTLNQQGIFVGYGTYTYKTGDGWSCYEIGRCINEIGQDVMGDMYRVTPYTQSSGVLMPTLTTTKSFENGNVSNVVTTTQSNTYHSNKLSLLQSSVTRSNSNEERVTINSYPFQYAANVNASSTGNAKGIYMLNTKNVLTTPLESYTYLQSPGGANQRVVSAVLSTFRQNAANLNHVVPDQVFLFESALPLAKTSFTPMTANGTGVTKDSRYVLRLNFSNYDGNSQITQFARTHDIANSFQYGYNNKLPVAEIKNAAPNEFKLEGFEDSSVAGVVTDLTQTQSGRKYFNGDYTISFTPPNGRSYVIEYFYFASPNWVFISKPYTGTSMALTEGTRIDNIRIRPSDAPMTSYTYDPLYGISSVTDPNCITTYYGYDTFGRLQIVKDHNNNAISTYNYHYYKQ